MQPLVGLIVILSLAYAISTNRRAIDRRTVAWGLGLQILFALIVLKTAVGQRTFQVLGATMNRLLDFSFVGSSMVFGPLGSKEVWPRIMNQVLGPEGAQWAVVFAFQVLPTIIFIAALFAVYYFGVMQVIVRLFAIVMRRVMRRFRRRIPQRRGEHLLWSDRGAADDPAAFAAHDRIGAMTVMTSGMARISGGIMAAHSFGIEAQHLLTAVIMTAPGTLMMAKVFVPETEVLRRWGLADRTHGRQRD